MFETWYKMASLIQSGLDLSPIITHHFHIDDFQQGFSHGLGQVRQGDPELGLRTREGAWAISPGPAIQDPASLVQPDVIVETRRFF